MNLTETARSFRIGANIFLVMVFMYIAYRVGGPVLVDYIERINDPGSVPTLGFGNLPPLRFVAKSVDGEVESYNIDTVSGNLPSGFPKAMPVYQVEKPEYSLEKPRIEQSNASKLGFTEDELLSNLRERVFVWRDKETKYILEIDTETGRLELRSNFPERLRNYTQGKLAKSIAENTARQRLTSANRLTTRHYARETGIVTLGSARSGFLFKASGPGDSNFARVDFFRRFGEYKVLGPDPHKGLISVTVTAEQGLEQIPLIEAYEWGIIDDSSHTYPIITVQEAWSAVANGNGVIASIVPENESIFRENNATPVGKVDIQEIYLAYYDTPVRQDYLQPIYVFEGTYNVGSNPGGEITIYFPAIQAQHIQSETQQTSENADE